MSAKNCQINLWNEHGWDLDHKMLQAVMTKLSHHLTSAETVDIYPQEQVPLDAPAWKRPGWLEWVINLRYRTGVSLTITALRRKPGHPVEFHT